jgi:hypothetical protein
VERIIEDYDLPVTILRPTYFIQNDTSMKDAGLLGHGVYPQPIGSKGISMVDTLDIAEAAALSLLKREHAAGPLPARGHRTRRSRPSHWRSHRGHLVGGAWAGRSATAVMTWWRSRSAASRATASGFAHHPLLLKAAHHEPHVPGHPARRKRPEPE